MLWAPEPLLYAFVSSVVNVRVGHVDLPHYRSYTLFENQGSFPMQVRVRVDGEPPVEMILEQGQQYFIWHRTAVGEVQVDWLNLQISSQDILQTTHRVDEVAR